MTDVPGGEENQAPDVADLLARLRAVEAHVELLDAAVRSQESLADRLTSAMESARQAQGQLADQHVGRVQRRVRGIARRAKRRVDQQLGRSEPVQAVETNSKVPGAEHASVTVATHNGSRSTTPWTRVREQHSRQTSGR